mmetsp:Transcript_4583/g.11538  ORF Transcript_4583/g.11538 Transcript_4583/m.11538 type:complete len:103 (+) Transcript_4583:2-310(+)
MKFSSEVCVCVCACLCVSVRVCISLLPKLLCVAMLAETPDGKVYHDITPTRSHFWPADFPLEMDSYEKCLIEAYSCVCGDVACNAAPAIPSPADDWHGPNNA